MFLYAFRVWVSTLITSSFLCVLYYETAAADSYAEIPGLTAFYLACSFIFSFPLFAGFLLVTCAFGHTRGTMIRRKALLSLLLTVLYILFLLLLGFRSFSGEDELQPVLHSYFAVSICFLWIFRLPGSGVTNDQGTDDW